MDLPETFLGFPTQVFHAPGVSWKNTESLPRGQPAELQAVTRGFPRDPSIWLQSFALRRVVPEGSTGMRYSEAYALRAWDLPCKPDAFCFLRFSHIGISKRSSTNKNCIQWGPAGSCRGALRHPTSSHGFPRRVPVKQSGILRVNFT